MNKVSILRPVSGHTSRGDICIIRDRNVEYKCILVQVDERKMCLVELSSGNRMSSPVDVKNSLNVTEDELNKMLGGCILVSNLKDVSISIN